MKQFICSSVALEYSRSCFICWSRIPHGKAYIRPYGVSGRQVALYHFYINSLTHWPLGGAVAILISNFKMHIKNIHKYIKNFMWNCPEVNSTWPHWSLVNIDLGNCLVPSGNKPLPEPMLTQTYVAICCHKTTMNFSWNKNLYYDSISWKFFPRISNDIKSVLV